MPTCSNCRRVVESTTPGYIGDTSVVSFCDECMADIVGDKEAKKVEFPEA